MNIKQKLDLKIILNNILEYVTKLSNAYNLKSLKEGSKATKNRYRGYVRGLFSEIFGKTGADDPEGTEKNRYRSSIN